MISIKSVYNIFLVFASTLLCSFSYAQVEADTVKTTLAAIPGDTSLTASDTFIKVKNSEEVDQIINFAKKYLGTPYHYAGSTPSGFDCSGFIYYVMGNFGMEVTRSSYGLAEFGETVKLADIRPGDLMFFKGRDVHSTRVGHVALVIEVTPDAIRFIHASTSRGVTIDNFKSSKYYIPRFIKAKRLDYGAGE